MLPADRIRLVEQIEYVGAKLQVDVATERRVLDQRQIRVVVGGTDHDVAAKVAEPIDGGECRFHRTDRA